MSWLCHPKPHDFQTYSSGSVFSLYFRFLHLTTHLTFSLSEPLLPPSHGLASPKAVLISSNSNSVLPLAQARALSNLRLLFLTQALTNPAGNHSSSILKIYPEPDHFSSFPLCSTVVQCLLSLVWISKKVFMLSPLPLTAARAILLKLKLDHGLLCLRTLRKPPFPKSS